MTQHVDTDSGTVLRPDQAAMVYDDEYGFQFLVPNYCPDAVVPPEVLALIAVTLRLSHEPEFLEAQLEWMQEQKKG